MKKTLLILLCFILIIQSISVFSEDEIITDSNQAVAYKYEEEVVLSLDFLPENLQDIRSEEKTVSRMDFGILLYNMLNYQSKGEVNLSGQSYFQDVGEYHYGAAYLQYLVSMGIVSGDGGGMFYPEEPVTLEQAAKMAVVAAGYKGTIGETLKLQDYFAKARSEGLLNGLSLSPNKQLSSADAVRMAYNLMYMRYLNPSIYHEDYIKYQRNERFMNVVMGIYEIDGILDGAKGSSLQLSPLGKNNISIDGTVLHCTAPVERSMLGLRVAAFTDYESQYVISLVPKKNTILTLTSDEIVSYDNWRYTYIKDDRTEFANIFSGMYLLVNGFLSEDVSLLLPEYGEVRLIDNNNDGTYDVVYVDSYTSYVVDRVSVSDNTITMKNTDISGGRVRINLDNYEECDIFTKTGANTALRSIRENHVLTIATAETRYIRILSSDETVKGSIESTSIEQDEQLFLIGKTWYHAVKNAYMPAGNQVELRNVTVLLDVNGKAAGFVHEQDTWSVGYVVAVAEAKGISKDVQAKILTEDGKIEIFTLNNKTIFDGSRRSNTTPYEYLMAAYNNFKNEAEVPGSEYLRERMTTRLLRFNAVDGVIKNADTPTIMPFSEFKAPDELSNENMLLLRGKGHLYYKDTLRALKQVYPDRIDIDGDIMMTNNTKIFVIPPAENTAPRDSDYSVTTLSGAGFIADFYLASGYNFDASSLTADAVVVQKAAGSVDSQRLMVYRGYSKMLDDEGEIRYVINGLIDGMDTSYTLRTDSKYAEKLDSLTTGDVLRYSHYGSELDINGISYSNDKTGDLTDSDYYVASGSATHFNAPTLRITKGFGSKLYASMIYHEVADPEISNESIRVPDTIYVYDSNGHDKKEQVRIGSIADIHIKDQSAAEYDTVIVSMYNGSISEFIIVR